MGRSAGKNAFSPKSESVPPGSRMLPTTRTKWIAVKVLNQNHPNITWIYSKKWSPCTVTLPQVPFQQRSNSPKLPGCSHQGRDVHEQVEHHVPQLLHHPEIGMQCILRQFSVLLRGEGSLEEGIEAL